MSSDKVFISITITFVFSIIIIPKITYSFPFKIIIIIFLLKSVLISLIILPLINLLVIFFSFSNFFFSFFFFFFCIKKCPNISNYSANILFFFIFFSIKVFLMLILFWVSDLLSFFPLPQAACLGVFVLRRLSVLSLKVH